MAGILLKVRFPRRQMFQTVISNLFRYMFRGAARNWFRNVGSAAPALSSMTLLLLLSGLVGLVGFALHNIEVVQAREASLLHVYMRDDATNEQVNALWDRLSADSRIATVSYTTRAEALARAQHLPGLPQLADASASNPFPASLDARVKNKAAVGE